MICPEQLISNLQEENQRLKEELEQAQTDIKDFEVLAVEWKSGYSKLNTKHSIAIQEKDQIIKELQDELLEFKANREY
jgi:predicted RNase H-like nuclease (RuvC/YqgF family)